jgi:hypothetical protein
MPSATAPIATVRAALERRKAPGSIWAATVLITLGFAVNAHAAAIGIAETDPRSFVRDDLSPNPKWENLNVRFARAIFPYDVAQRPAGDPERRRLTGWLIALARTGTGANVSFRDNGHIPSEAEFKAAFQAFISTYGPGTAANVTLVGPWNEPNFKGIGATTSAGQHLWDPNCPASGATIHNCMPRLAAYYYRWATKICPTCTLAAGEFAGSRSRRNAAYVDAYKTNLGYHRPALVAVHTYTDPKRYQLRGDNRALETRWFVQRLLGDSHFSKAHMWISATGAYRRVYTHGKVRTLSEKSQCRATAFIQRLPGLAPSRITRIYYYTHFDGSGKDETGLLGKGDARTAKERLAYWNIKHRDHVCHKRKG